MIGDADRGADQGNLRPPSSGPSPLAARAADTRAAVERLRREDPVLYGRLGDAVEGLLYFAEAGTWFSAKRVVERYPNLLTAEVGTALERIAADASAGGNPQLAGFFIECHRLLDLCRSEGIDAAFEQLARSIVARSPAMLERWMEVADQHPSLYWDLIPLLDGMLQRARNRGGNDMQTQTTQALLLNELGLAYRSVPAGDRAANIERAIVCLDEAIRLCPRPGAVELYASLCVNLGIALRSSLTGDEGTNIRKAIACYREALTVYTAQATPQDYADTQLNLGNAYAELPSLDRKPDLEQAIVCYKAALSTLRPEEDATRYARTLSALGLAYTELPVDDAEPNLKAAMACFQDALRICTPDTAPFDYGGIQINLAKLYRRLPWGEHSQNVSQAIACYEQALSVFTPGTAPAMHRLVARNLGNLYFDEGHFENAHRAYAATIADVGALYYASGTETARQAELGEGRSAFSNDSYCLARLGRLTEAVERLEAAKTVALAEALALDRAPLEGVLPADRAAFEAARERVRKLEEAARAIDTGDHNQSTVRRFVQISSELHTAHRALAAVIDHIRQYAPKFMTAGVDFAAIAQAAAPANPLVYLFTTTQGSLALIVPPGADALDDRHIVRLDRLRFGNLSEVLFHPRAGLERPTGYLFCLVKGDAPRLQAALDELLPLLRKELTGPLVARLGELSYRQATLIPSGLLDLLPLHATCEPVVVSYAPSARVLQAAAYAAGERAALAPILLGVGNPLPSPAPLPFARTEVEAIMVLFDVNARRALYEEQATRANLQEQLAGATYLHFSCHGQFSTADPLDSAIHLGGDGKVSLRNLLDGELDLSSSRLAVLSACQTGIVDFSKVPDEAIGLPAGFLQAGVPAVISTLWPVVDLSTALLLERFYRYHREESLDPAAALHRAQAWLRDATAAEMDLASHYQRLYEASGGRNKTAWRWMRYFRGHPAERPYTHPYYWAAFIFVGASVGKTRPQAQPPQKSTRQLLCPECDREVPLAKYAQLIEIGVDEVRDNCPWCGSIVMLDLRQSHSS